MDLLSQHYNQEREAGLKRDKEKSKEPLIKESDSNEEDEKIIPIPPEIPIDFSNNLSDILL